MKVRHFIYADAKEISSLYSQIFDDVNEVNTTVSRENKTEINIETPNILQGFLQGNFSGDFERDCNNVVSKQSHISIETKMISLLKYIGMDENKTICQWSDKLLVVGSVKAMKYDSFIEKADELLKKGGLTGVDEFLTKNCESDNFGELWKELCGKLLLNKWLHLDKFDMFCIGEPVVETLITTNTDYPIIINFSYNKLLLSASEMANYSRLCCLDDMSVLGLMRLGENNCYTLKPIAMWEIFELGEADDRFMWQVKHFKDYWKNR